ncbi:9508_t:CDS:2 [Ambispora gerdemannii]|uniref:MICOS complex subunit MIC10 n=1 Tax=Ambispora gerdemannii TaxID=144530 RepID=A0A9N9BGU3_9GLOM|nr:9508_t:CDS:2 [Ambispora gerdemannii]
MVSEENIPSEEILNEKWDKCISNLLVKTGIGLSVGIIASALIFRKRTWPIAISTGFGIGVAYADCQRTFIPTAIPGVRIVKANNINSES